MTVILDVISQVPFFVYSGVYSEKFNKFINVVSVSG